MGVTQEIREKIKEFAEGETFTYKQLSIASEKYVAAAKALERLIAQGVIKRVSTGVFYKPQKSVFGELKPSEEELLKSYLFENGNRVAYITGTSLYNKMSLTTQVPNTIKVASRDKKIKISKGNLKASPVKSYVDVTEENYQLLGILDALKDFNRIPDLDKKSGIKILLEIIKSFNAEELKVLIKSALSYPPRVKAFLGALLESIGSLEELKVLKQNLNPLSEYNYSIDAILPTAKNWNIK